MPVTTAAVIGGIGAATAVAGTAYSMSKGGGGGGGGAGNAALQAAQLQYQSSQDAIRAQEKAIAEARAYEQPFYEGGLEAWKVFGGLQNVPGFAPVDPTATLRATPGYDFMMKQGVNALDRSAASRGMTSSGPQAKALQTYGQGQADQTYNNYLNRLWGMAGAGQNAAALQGGYGMTGANNIGQYNLMGGQALGQGVYNNALANQMTQQQQQQNYLGLGGLGMGLFNANRGGLSNWFNSWGGNNGFGTTGQTPYGGYQNYPVGSDAFYDQMYSRGGY
jgi:hypothetical protein